MWKRESETNAVELLENRTQYVNHVIEIKMLLGQLMQCRKPKCNRKALERHGISWHCNWGPFNHYVFCRLDVKCQISQIMLCLKMRAPLRSYVGLAPLRSYEGLEKHRKTQSLSILSISYPGPNVQFSKSKYMLNIPEMHGTIGN